MNPERGGLISWRSKKQPIIALSTCEAEYVAMSNATKEGLHLKQLLDEFGVRLDHFLLHGDNQGALALAKDNVRRERSKHIDLKYHFLRQHVTSGELNLRYVESASNVADLFTKPPASTMLRDMRPFMFCTQ